ncbi:E3 ubiquitin-protein ligase RNF103 [Boleophthalmus pectinirostris]|uniref:E3 ubiquitin-protein ligase RNF103 n=1 Tax=Boleophthalmus pectinirostris TaxID=150288 RepID=UPI00242BDABB|nr:E3 ubiquitin-protein ligase RNF103 [Boleophthalmus pectinirostris]
MWLKLLFLTLYLLLLFLLARLFEAVVWCEAGVLATQLVDPVTLSYNKLKMILEARGLAYSALAQKEDVRELVEKSGDLSQGELYSTIKKEKEHPEGDGGTTHFSGELHFYELVEDTKDGIWLVQVVAQGREALLSQYSWRKMVKKVSQFGIRTGIFNCSSDHRSCMRRGWHQSTLIMSVPQTSASKGKVMLKEYRGQYTDTENLSHWVTGQVAQQIHTLHCSEQLLQEWYSDHTVKMFLFAHLPQPPAFFSSLSVRFTGRIKFIFVNICRWKNHSSLVEIGVTRSPAYVLKMPEGMYWYGKSPGEFLSVSAMDTFLRSVQPEVNDVFVLSLLLINLLAWMDLFITQGATVKRFVVLIRTLGTYNSILLVSWLPVLALLQLPYLDTFYSYSLKLLRYADTTQLVSLVRADWTFYSSHPALFLSTYLAHGLLVDYFEKKRRCSRRSLEDSSTNLEWLASLWDWYSSYLLHPITSLHQSDHSEWDEDTNFLFERLAFPDLWLRPLVNLDYMKILPVWKFKSAQSSVTVYSPSGALEEQACLDRTSDSECDDNTLLCDWSEWPHDILHCSECVICLENFVNGELLMGLFCGHAFHQSCIVVWLAEGQHCCPVCRWPSYKKKRPTKSNSTVSSEPA